MFATAAPDTLKTKSGSAALSIPTPTGPVIKKPVRTFKAGIDTVDARRRRGETGVELRKNNRDAAISKKRMAISTNVVGGGIRATSVVDKSVSETKVSSIASTSSTLASSSSNVASSTIIPSSTLANTDIAKAIAERALANRTQAPELAQKFRTFPAVVEGLNHNSLSVQIESVIHIRKLLAIENNPPIQEIVDCNVIPRLIQFLTQTQNPTLQFEAAWAITNIASGTTGHTKALVDAGVIPVLLQLIRLPENPSDKSGMETVEQVIWALGNIAGDNYNYRDQILHLGAVDRVVSLLKSNRPLPQTMLRNIAWTLSNLCRGEKSYPPFEVMSGVIPAFAYLLQSTDIEVLIDACWGLSYVAEDNGPTAQKIPTILQHNIVGPLLGLLNHKDHRIRVPALRTVGNVATGDDAQTGLLLKSGLLARLLPLINDPKKSIRKETFWTISNVTAGNTEQIQMVFDHNLIPPLLYCFKSVDSDLKKEIAWALGNACTGGSTAQRRFLVKQGIIPPMCDLFSSPDSKTVLVALEAIEALLSVGKTDGNARRGTNEYAEFVEECGGLDLLENLQRHENEDIYNKAVAMLKQYFESVDDNDESVSFPSVSSDGSSFSFG
jgi:importin subunit alpha-1